MRRLFILLSIISFALVQCDEESNPLSENSDANDTEINDSISVNSVSLVYNTISNDHLYFTTDIPYNNYYGNLRYSYALDLDITFKNGDSFDQIDRIMLFSGDGIGWEFDSEILQSLTYQDSTLSIPNIILTYYSPRDLKFEMECFDDNGNSLDTYEFIMSNKFPEMLYTDHNWRDSDAIDLYFEMTTKSRDVLTNMNVSWTDSLQNVLSNEEIEVSGLSTDNTLRMEIDNDDLFGFYSVMDLNVESVRQQITTHIRNVGYDRPPDNIVKFKTSVLHSEDVYDDSWNAFHTNLNENFIYFDSKNGVIYELNSTDGSIHGSHKIDFEKSGYNNGFKFHYDRNSNRFAYLSGNNEISVYDLTTKETLFSKSYSSNFSQVYFSDSTLYHLNYNILTASTSRNDTISESEFSLSRSGDYLHYDNDDSIMYVTRYSGSLHAYKLNYETSNSEYLTSTSTSRYSYRFYDISHNRIISNNGSVTQLNNDDGNYSLSVIKNLDMHIWDLRSSEGDNLLLFIGTDENTSRPYRYTDKLYVYDLNSLEKVNEIDLFYNALSIGIEESEIKVFEYYDNRRDNSDGYSLAIESFQISELRSYGKNQNKSVRKTNKLTYFLPVK